MLLLLLLLLFFPSLSLSLLVLGRSYGMNTCNEHLQVNKQIKKEKKKILENDYKQMNLKYSFD